MFRPTTRPIASPSVFDDAGHGNRNPIRPGTQLDLNELSDWTGHGEAWRGHQFPLQTDRFFEAFCIPCFIGGQFTDIGDFCGHIDVMVFGLQRPSVYGSLSRPRSSYIMGFAELRLNTMVAVTADLLAPAHGVTWTGGFG